MTPMLDIVARSSAVLALGWIAVWMLGRRTAALRHGVLAATIAGAALVAPLSWIVPPLTVSWPSPPPLAPAIGGTAVRVTAVDRFAVPVAPASTSPGITTTATLATIWIAGTVGHLAVLLSSLGRLGRVRRRARPVDHEGWEREADQLAARHGLTRRVGLISAAGVDLVATWGVRHPVVMVPESAAAWPAARIRAVLAHELAHVARSDWLFQVAAEVVRALYWFNPLAVAACRRLRHESELACDDRVLGHGMPAHDYATHLIHVARLSTAATQAVPMARPGALERRIEAMFDHRSSRAALTRRGILGVAAAATAAVISIAALHAGQAGPRALSGTVYDPSGAVLPQVAITLADERENRWQTTSDASGRFEFPAIGAGTYTLAASLPGFRMLDEKMTLSAPGDWERAVTLQVGDLRETMSVRAARPAAGGPAAADSAAPVPVRVGGNIKPPTRVRDALPVYPRTMQEAGLEAVVPIEAVIATDGVVTSARILTAQVHPDFAAAALAAVRQWRFSPTLLNGKPVEVRMSVSIAFALED